MEEIYKGYTIKLEQDDLDESPREWENLGTMVCGHNRYTLGDKDHDIVIQGEWWNPNKEEYEYCNSWADVVDQIIVKEGELAVILPLMLYDHSGITMYVSGDGGYRQHEAWDSGQVGFIYLTKEKARKEYNYKRLTKRRLEMIEKDLRGEVKVYDQFITGDVYYYSVRDRDEEVIDACGGFYGYESALEEAKAAVDAHIEELRLERLARTKKLIQSNVPLIYRT